MRYYTVKEFAEKVSISRQAVYSQLDKKLTDYLKPGASKVLISEQALDLFKKCQALDKELDKELDTNDKHFVKLIDSMDRTIDTLEKTLDTLQDQLSAKDKEIERLYGLLEKEQYLHAHSQKELLAIETRVATMEQAQDQKKGSRRKWFGKNKE